MKTNHPPRRWNRLASKVHEVGLRYALTLGLRSMIPAAFFRFTQMAILKMNPRDVASRLDENESVRWATPKDLRLLEAFGHKVEVLQGRFAAGARAYIYTEEEKLLGYVWFHGPVHDEEDLGVRFVLGPGEIWLFDAMIKSDQRGRGLYPKLLQAAACALAREGVERILIAIEIANRNSLQAHKAAGAELIGFVCGLRLLGVTLVHHGRGIRTAWTGASGYLRLPTSIVA